MVKQRKENRGDARAVDGPLAVRTRARLRAEKDSV